MRSRGSRAGTACVRFDVRNRGADAHRAAGGLHRGLVPPFPRRNSREGTLALAFAWCLPMERAVAERESVVSATVVITRRRRCEETQWRDQEAGAACRPPTF